jgi:hypothetical protein
MVIISLCDMTGNMVRPWAEAGHSCLCLDLGHSIRADRVEGNVTYRWADVRSLTPSDLPIPGIIFAAPPCTHLAVSGARDFAKKGLRALIDALEVVEACRKLAEWYGCPWMLENPVSRLSTCWRKPDFTFDPCDFGDPYTKKTCLWVGNGFVMPPKQRVEPTLGSAMHLMAPTDDRASRRAETPMGFARAVFASNEPRSNRHVA